MLAPTQLTGTALLVGNLGGVLPLEGIVGVAQVSAAGFLLLGVVDAGAQLFGHVSHQVGLGKVAAGLPDQFLHHAVTTQSHVNRHHVTEGFVESAGLGAPGVHVFRTNRVQQGMPDFVGHDVGRSARMHVGVTHRVILHVEVDGAAFALVVRVEVLAAVGTDQQAVELERPFDGLGKNFQERIDGAHGAGEGQRTVLARVVIAVDILVVDLVQRFAQHHVIVGGTKLALADIGKNLGLAGHDQTILGIVVKYLILTRRLGDGGFGGGGARGRRVGDVGKQQDESSALIIAARQWSDVTIRRQKTHDG